MTRLGSSDEERAIIVHRAVKRPYGVKARIQLQTAGSIGDVGDVCVSLNTGAFLSISPTPTAPWDGSKNFIVTLEGFPTATSADAAGRRLVQALLWMAVSIDIPLRLEYFGHECASVFERNRSAGITCESYAYTVIAPNVVLGELQDAYAQLGDTDKKLRLSMEIFCAARLESCHRAVYLALVSSLEPLAEAAPLGNAVDTFVAECTTRLHDSTNIPPNIRTSLEGRLNQLRKESIRQALKRIVCDSLPDQPGASAVVDGAYALRSQLIHGGTPSDPDIDFEDNVREISAIIRDIYASLLNRSLARSNR